VLDIGPWAGLTLRGIGAVGQPSHAFKAGVTTVTIMVPSLSDRAPGANPSHDASSGPDVKSTSRRTAFALACGCWFFGQAEQQLQQSQGHAPIITAR
jgi:hypothetical protein